MIKRLVLASVLGLSATLLMSVDQASAQMGQPCGNSRGLYAQGYGFGVGLGYGAFTQSSRSIHDRIPYFALHPPVYYSDQIVRRPYGISPFAAPPGIKPIEMDYIPQAEAEVIENPYFQAPQPAPEKGAEEKTAEEVGPLPPKPSMDQQASHRTRHLQSRSQYERPQSQVVINPYYIDRSMVSRRDR